MARIQAPIEEDVGNIIGMEHVNVTVPDQRLAELFYVTGLGFTRDPYMMVGPGNLWVNVGEQQFHLPNRSPQRIPGHIGLVVADLEALQERLKAVQDKLTGTEFAWAVEKGYVAVTCPWGNKLRCYPPGPEFGGMAVGIPYVEFLVKPNTAAAIAQFYTQIMKAPASVEQGKDGAVARIQVGLVQSLVFRESTGEIPAYDGYHIAVYVASFSQPYAYLKRHDLIMQDVARSQFRFKDIVNPKTGERVLELEHEVRSLRHAMYGRGLVNRDPTQNIQSYARGGDALSPVAR